MARNELLVNASQWSEFLDKLDFVQLTDRWSMLPLHWLDEEPPEELFDSLSELKDEDEKEREDQLKELASEYRRKLAAQPLALDASLCPPGSRVNLRYLDPNDLGQGDCLITVGPWDRVGHLICERAGTDEEGSEGNESAVRREPGELSYRHLLIFPDKGTPSPRAFRSLCEKTLRQARGLGARSLTMTHLHLPQPGLSDHFAAAELVSAIRQMLRDGSGMTVEIAPFSHRVYRDYKHWFLSLKELTKSDEPERSDPIPEPEPEPEPAMAGAGGDVTSAFKQFAQRTTSRAQEAGTQVSSWIKSQTEGTGAVPGIPTRFSPSYEQRQDLNRLYLGLWSEVEPNWEGESLAGRYLRALYSVVRSLQEPEEDEEVHSREVFLLREEVLGMARELGFNNPVARYFKLLAYRLDGGENPEQLSGLHQELLDEAQAWDDLALVRFLQGQDPDSELENEAPELTPVYAVASRAIPDGGQEEEHNFERE